MEFFADAGCAFASPGVETPVRLCHSATLGPRVRGLLVVRSMGNGLPPPGRWRSEGKSRRAHLPGKRGGLAERGGGNILGAHPAKARNLNASIQTGRIGARRGHMPLRRCCNMAKQSPYR
uniref:Uncharacterized protein n=1 Tax=Trichuris muris TaxID=70415 RepID=A0A5S6QQN5_TRIMR